MSPRAVPDRSSLALIAIALVLFLPILAGGTIGVDDRVYFQNNPVITQPGLAGLWGAWSERVFGYEPVTLSTIWFDLQVFGSEAWGWYRLHSLGWFILWILAVRRIITVLTGSENLGWVVAAVCLVHPVDAPLVLWPALRRQVVCLALSFWSVALIMDGSGRLTRRFWFGCLLALFAVWSRFSGIMVAALIPLIERMSLPWNALPSASWWRRWTILGLVCAGAAAVVVLAAHEVAFQPYRLGGDWLGTIILDGSILRSYLWHVIAPWNLTAYYGINETISLTCLFHWLCVIGAVVGTWLAAGDQRRLVALCWFAGAVSLVPCLNLINQAYVMADHYLAPALPFLVTICLILVLRLTSFLGQARLAPLRMGLLAAVTIACALGTIARGPQFKDRARFLADGLEANPESGFLLAYQCHWALHEGGDNARLAAPSGAAAWMAHDLRRSPLDPMLAATMAGIPRLITFFGPERAWSIISAQANFVPEDILALAQAWYLVQTRQPRAADAIIRSVATLEGEQEVFDRMWNEFQATGRLPDLIDGEDPLSSRQHQDRLNSLYTSAALVVVTHGLRAHIDQLNGRPLEAAKRALFCLRVSCIYPTTWDTLAAALDDLGKPAEARAVRTRAARIIRELSAPAASAQ